jgi:hypothetical protein
MSLLGLVRHMADVERGWFRWFMAGQDAPDLFSSKDDPDGDWDGARADPVLVEQAWQAWQAWGAWREEVAFAEQFVAAAPGLELAGKREDTWRGKLSLRWVLTHMVEEYASKPIEPRYAVPTPGRPRSFRSVIARGHPPAAARWSRRR